MPKPLRVFVALSVVVLLLAVLASLAQGSEAPEAAVAQPVGQHTLRAYGREHFGAGDTTATDLVTGRYPEDPPYTVSEPIFNPQLLQAPVKDSITWNPLYMSEFQTFDENYAQGLYNQIFAGSRNATEKVWFRMWYEPWHWDKDLNANDVLDIRVVDQVPFPPGVRDEWYPAVMQEFTYMLLEPQRLVDTPQPLAGPVGRTRFVFPVGMREEDLFTAGGQVDTGSPNARYGYGLTSLDGDFDGEPDIVHVESELSLFSLTRIAADFNGNQQIDPLDLDATELNGTELAVFRLEPKSLAVDRAVQFLDHVVIVRAVFNDSALLDVWYTGDMVPAFVGSRTINIGDMLLAGTAGPPQQIRAVANGGPGTNMCDFPTGPFFVYLDGIDQAEDPALARLMVGRALGATWSAMEDTPFQQDTRPRDPWFLKRFYVDGHEYNVVAIKTELVGVAVVYPTDCDLDDGNDGVIDTWPPPLDPTLFKFITIRTPIPKWGEYADPEPGYLIAQHSVRLQPYHEQDYLSVMPPYNYEHYVIMDIQALDEWTCLLPDVRFFGQLVGPVPPILQYNGPFPYQGVGPHSPYADRREMALFYVDEDKNPQFLGELKEKYGEVQGADEFWYVEQFHTLPWEYTEFVLPDLNPDNIQAPVDRYLLTSSFLAEQSEYVLWTQGVPTDTTGTYNVSWDIDELCWTRDEGVDTMFDAPDPNEWSPRLKFWFDPAEGGEKYKDADGIRMYGFSPLDLEELPPPGDPTVDDPLDATYPVEVLPYTDPWAPFNPQMEQAPWKDSLTFNPAYMNEFINSGEPLVDLYRQISIREQNAYEKVFLRMWYEPEYLDKILVLDPLDTTPPFTETEVYTFPAVMQEFTYMYLDTRDRPASAQPKSSRFAFPMATAADELPAPDPATYNLPPNLLPSFGYGLTTFDGNFDGFPDAVQVNSERTLATRTGITADFDGDAVMDILDTDGAPSSGDEMVIFALEDMVLQRGDSVQFLDHMATLENISRDDATLRLWYTGGGLHAVGTEYSLHPDRIGSYRLQVGEMAIANHSQVRVLPAGGTNADGSWNADGAWFVFVDDIDSSGERVSLIVGRALGATHSAMDDGLGSHDELPGDPWYLKRFFVDGHEYNVVALHMVPATIINPGDEPYEFKYITIRTPVPKVNFINYEDSQKLEGYYRGLVFGEDSDVISVMPPFNSRHTAKEDVQTFPERAIPPTGCPDEPEAFVFANRTFYEPALWCPPNIVDPVCVGDVLKDKPPYQIRIVDEDRDPQFFGELKEKYNDKEVAPDELWQTEQFHMVPDQYTKLSLPEGQLYLLTSDWTSEQSRVHYWGCDDPIWRQDDLNGLNPDIPVVNASLPNVLGRPPREFFEADVGDPLRVKFWYDPADGKDVYVNTWLVPGGDITPPSIISVRETEDPICEAGTGSPSQVIIRADVSDPCGVAWVRLHYRAPGGSWQFVTMTPEGGDTYAATVGPFAQPGTMEYYVEAADNCGNVGETTHYSVTVEDCGGDEPAIANIRVSAAPLCRETTGSPDTTTVRADVTHPSGIDWVVLHYQPPGGSWTSKPMSFEAGDTYAATVGPFSQAGLLNYYVEAMPNLGDPGESPHQAVIVENCGGDISPPDIDNITESDDPICRQGTGIPDIITISADVSDPSGVNWAHLHYQQLPGSMWTWVPMSLVIGDTYEDTIGPFSQVGIYSYYVRARDWVGNEIQSDLSTFVVVECTGPTPTQTQTPTTTPTMPTPTPTATLPPGETGAIQGKVLLQGRANHSGVQVTAGGVSGWTASNGGFTIPGVPAGTHSVMAEMAGYLEHVKIGVVVPAGVTVPLLDVRLLGGDASGDCTINLFDLVTVALNYGSTTPTVPAADINGNGVVDLFDLVMTAVNLDLGCPGAWPVPPAFDLQAAAPIHLRVSPETQSLQIGDEFEVTLELQEASNLYGADVTLTFDPDVLEVVDADPTTQGVQISRGTFPNPDQGIVTKEEADNTAGTANYAMSLKTPAQPAAGDGTLCMIRFRAKARGTSDLAISAATLLDPNADPIEVMSHDGSINVTAEVHSVFLPVMFRSETDR